jgi:RNA polymerase sigma factor (sigma-70 family)
VTAAAGRVWVVDDEPDVLDALEMLLRSADYDVTSCRSAEELLQQLGSDEPGCIVLDLRMPGMSGLDVQRELERRGLPQPVVFLSAHGDIPVAIRTIRRGAVDFLEKPVKDTELFDAVERALDEDRTRRRSSRHRREAQKILDLLSPREAQVADLLLAGLKTQEMAERLGLSPRTVEMHRTRLLKRVGARTSAEAVRVIAEARDLVGDD